MRLNLTSANRVHYAVLFAIGFAVYALVAGSRLFHQSEAPHFVYQADAWLHGHADVQPGPNDDWAMVETVGLDDGSEAQGRRTAFTHPQVFQLLGGGTIPIARVKRSLGFTAYVSFPPVPSAIMLPGALLAGRGAPDVFPTVLVAALILPLCLLMLRRLAAAGLSKRSLVDDLWLVAALAFGSVLFFSSVQGKVWYTAHVVGVALALVYLWGSIEAAHPIAAGLALGAAALTRTSMAFMFPLFLLELWRVRTDRARTVRTLAKFAVPVIAFAILGMIYNEIRFHSLTEFGHRYLALGNHQPVRQQEQIETWGLASFHYLPRNLAVAFGQIPQLSPFRISGHGLALWLTTPLLFLLVWPRDRGPTHRALWITVVCVAAPSLLYMNSGWFQFGYRFSLDYLVFLIALVAIGGRPLGGLAKGLIAFGIAFNLFGAITFGRYDFYSYDYAHIHVLDIWSVDN